jgi:hypothetical protein
MLRFSCSGHQVGLASPADAVGLGAPPENGHFDSAVIVFSCRYLERDGPVSIFLLSFKQKYFNLKITRSSVKLRCRLHVLFVIGLMHIAQTCQ